MISQVLDHASQHHGLVRLEALQSIGVTRKHMDAWTGRGLLSLEGRSVYRAPGSPPTWRQHALRGVWTVGPTAHASHRTAAALWGLSDGRGVEVLVPKGTGARMGTASVHETRHLTGVDVDERDGIPVTSIERTLVDLARVLDLGSMARTLDAAVQRELTTYRGIERRLRTMPTRGRKGVVLLRMLLAERLGSPAEATNPFEEMMRRILRDSDLPTPTRQEKVEQGGQRYYIDFAFPAQMVAVECDGLLGHGSPAAQAYDLQRQNDIIEAGWNLRRFPWSSVRNDPSGTLSSIRRAMMANGWTPPPQLTGLAPATEGPRRSVRQGQEN